MIFLFDFCSSEKTTSYRRTSSGGGSQGKCSTLSPNSVGSQEELYCSLVGSSLTPVPASATAPARSSSPVQSCIPRPRRNAMVHTKSAFSLMPRRFCLCFIKFIKFDLWMLQVSGSRPHHKLVKALVDCRAVSSEHLAFFKDEIIVVTSSSDPHWWVSATSACSYPNPYEIRQHQPTHPHLSSVITGGSH